MQKSFTIRILLFWTLFLFGYSQLYAFDEKRDKEVKTVELEQYLEMKEKCLKAEKDSAYLWIKFSNDQARFIRKESQKLPNFVLLINMANLRKDMQKLEKYKTRKKEHMVNIENAFSSYSDSIQQIGTLSSQALKHGFTRHLDFLMSHNDEEQIQVLNRVQKHVEEYQKNKRVNPEQWKKDIVF